MFYQRLITTIILLALIIVAPCPSIAGEYTPPGLYNVERFQLPNGITVLLKPRKAAHNVAIRLVVNIGSRYFDCDKRQTPHFLEHLVFTGTSQHTEAELDRIIEEHGGSWNAATGSRYTLFTMDIYDKYLPIGLDTLYEVLTDPVFKPEQIERTRDIIRREFGGRQSWIRRRLYQYGIGKDAWAFAWERLLPGPGAFCSGFPKVDSILPDDILSAYRDFYTPRNMTLVAVGNFDRGQLLRKIRQTFGSMKRKPVRINGVTTPPYPSEPAHVNGTLSPLLGSSAAVGVAYRTEGSDSPDFFACGLLETYLSTELYEKIRLEKGLSYSPETSLTTEPDYGVFYISVDADLNKIEEVRSLIHDAVEKLRKEPLTPDDLERIKQNVLLQWVQGYETNAGMADFYAGSLEDLRKRGKFLNIEKGVSRVTSADIHNVVLKYLRIDREINVTSTPTLTYTQFYVLLGLFIAGLIAAVFLIYRKIQRQKERADTPAE